MPNFAIEPADRFPGEFHVRRLPEHELSQPEDAYNRAVDRSMDKMADDIASDPQGNDEASVALRQARERRRAEALRELREQAEEFVAQRLEAQVAADNVFSIRGKYVADLDRMEQSLFVVEPALENGQVVDVLIRVADELPLASDPAAQEKQALYVALDHARTVVKTVAARIESRTERFWRLKNTREREQARAKRLKNQYMKKLVDIGRLGLQHSHIELAKLALEGFRAEFVAQEAGRIKNTYLSSLGAAAGLVAILLFLGYALISCCADKTGFFYLHKIFLIAAGGAAIGTWLSFSIRRVTLGFDDLSILEEDFLDPSLRILFVIALTVVVFLLFWTGAMNIEIGNLKTGDLAKPNSPLPLGAISLLVGIFCGIAERSLATAVAGRASGFVKSINL